MGDADTQAFETMDRIVCNAESLVDKSVVIGMSSFKQSVRSIHRGGRAPAHPRTAGLKEHLNVYNNFYTRIGQENFRDSQIF